MPRTQGECAWSRSRAKSMKCLNGPGKSPAARMVGMNRRWRERSQGCWAHRHNCSSRAGWAPATWCMGRTRSSLARALVVFRALIPIRKSGSSALSMNVALLRPRTTENPGTTRACTLDCGPGSPRVREKRKSAPISIVRRAPPTASSSLVSPHRRRAKPSPSLFRSTEERRRSEFCRSFRSSEERHAGFTTFVLGCLSATRGCRGNRVALSKGGDNTCCSASSLLPRRASLATGGCEALGTTYPHPSGWRPKREPKSRLPAPRRSGTRRAWYGQPR
jgi:hypothetical protein